MTQCKIIANLMTDTQFSYQCLMCSKRHWHGNGGDPITNRVECRGSHCKAVHQDVKIYITDETVRKLKPKRKQKKNDSINQNQSTS